MNTHVPDLSRSDERIASNLALVKERIDAAASRAGRPGGDVELVVVTKYRSVIDIKSLLRAGHRLMGESRLQESSEKIKQLSSEIRWHMIGHIQTNKAKFIPGLFEMAHSLDSVRLARALDKAHGAWRDQHPESPPARLDILLQFNIAGEASKHGFAPDEANSVLREIAALKNLRVRGLMTMAPHVSDSEQIRPVFGRLRQLRDRLRELGVEGANLEHLSMGMSNDFEVAVEEGATIVRVGSAVFQ